MDHKAFLFRFSDFQRELQPLLEGSLASGDVGPLIAFIDADRGSLRDPYEGQPLPDDWQDLLETQDVHQYGDIALTKYYDPRDDNGLGVQWREIQGVLESKLGRSTAVLGRPLGAERNYFDPGKMGSYFMSEHDVSSHLRDVEQLLEPMLQPLRDLLRKATAARTGLFVTF
jgi:hypothetical protein